MAEATLTYQLTDFTTSGGVVNSQILLKELKTANLEATVNGVAPQTTQCIIILDTIDGYVSVDDENVVDGYVAAHAGASFSSTLQKEILEVEDGDDSGDEVTRLTLSTGPMPKGTYLASFGMEIATTTAGGGVTAARGILYVRKNNSAWIEKAQHNNGEAQWQKFSEMFATDVEDGDSFEIQLRYRRLGTSGNAARVRFARLVWLRVGN